MRERNEEPVLTGDVLEQRINAHLASKNMRKLDPHEFSSMMRFMHENGIILNYDSVFLSDKYFTDPQWLADQLAYVITIKEIQDYGSSGIVKIDDFLSKMKKIQVSVQQESYKYFWKKLHEISKVYSWIEKVQKGPPDGLRQTVNKYGKLLKSSF